MRAYFILEDIALTAEQRSAIFSETEAAGDHVSPYPNYRCHLRKRLDDKAWLYEGDWDDFNPGALISRLATAGVLGQLRAQPSFTENGKEFEFQAQSSNQWIPVMRWIIFGMTDDDLGIPWGWEESHDAILAYLSANLAEWEDAQIF